MFTLRFYNVPNLVLIRVHLKRSRYIYFGPWGGFVYGTRATMADHELFSGLLKEADAVLGCSGRSWIRDENLRYTDTFVLHGIRTGMHNQSNVWRLSPKQTTRDHLAFAQDHGSGGLNVTGAGLAFDWCTGFASCTARRPQLANATLQFEVGAVLPPPPSPVPLAPAGVWISQPSNCTWCVRVVWNGGVSNWPISQSTRVGTKTDDALGTSGCDIQA